MRTRAGSSNLIAIVALFVALGGTAVAAKPLVTGADVQDGSLSGADISDGSTLKGVDIDESDLATVQTARQAEFATDADTVDGIDASQFATRPMYAFIQADQRLGEPFSIVYGRGVTDVHDASSATGAAVVVFERSLENCVVQVTGGLGDPAGTGTDNFNHAIPRVEMNAPAVLGDGGATPRAHNQVLVTLDADGADNGFFHVIPSPFMITAFC